MRKYNKYVICGDFVQAWTTKGEQFFLDLKDLTAIKVIRGALEKQDI